MIATYLDSAYTAEFKQLCVEIKSDSVTGAFSTDVNIGFV